MMDNEAQKAFLLELYSGTQADTGAQQSMYALGIKIGLDRTQAKKTAEDLIGMGLVEIKTLSGAVGITQEGIAAALQQGAAPLAENSFRLSTGPWIDEPDRHGLAPLVETLRQAIVNMPQTYSQLEEMVLDIKTMEVHLLSLRPKTAVIKALLEALRTSFTQAGDRDTAAQIERVLG